MSAELKEALAWWDWQTNRPNVHVRVAFEAARRVAEADEVWWCETHRHSGIGPISDSPIKPQSAAEPHCYWLWFLVASDEDISDLGKCRMVPGRLLLPAEEEK